MKPVKVDKDYFAYVGLEPLSEKEADKILWEYFLLDTSDGCDILEVQEDSYGL